MINLKKLREHSSTLHWFLLDLAMVALALLYLVWSVLDYLFRTKVVGRLMEDYAPDWAITFYHAYTSFDSIFYDTLFVSIFLSELLLRWGVAIYRNTYQRWFFYPFVHWYDAIGCIPFGAFKLFRFLRIFFVAYRLHQLEVINLKGNFFYENIRAYWWVLIEEISDRVTISILNGIQGEISKGTPVTDRMVREVLLPQKQVLVEWLSHRVQRVAEDTRRAYEADIRQYIDRVIKEAVHQNEEISAIERIPLVGSNLGNRLEKAISDIVFHVVDQSMRDLASPANKVVINDVTDIAIESVLLQEEDWQLDMIMKHVVHQAIELIKEQVKVQQWKQHIK